MSDELNFVEPINDINEIWMHSSNCMTNCLRKSKSKLVNEESYYIKYDLYEPTYEINNSDCTQIGIFKDEIENYYRYTGVYFFGTDFNDIIQEAEEIEITFKLIKDDSTSWNFSNAFNNNIILKGHSFESYDSLISNWNTDGINEFKYHSNCPYYCSGYDELKNAIESDVSTITFKLNTALIKEFELHNIKGFHLYCHDSVDGSIKIDNKCEIKVIKFKNPYEGNVLSKESIVVKNKKMYNEYPFLHAGSVNYHSFFMFEDEFENVLNIADEIEITFNLLWFLPSQDKSVAINVNNNFVGNHVLKDAVVLTGHTFKNMEELKQCKTKEEFFELKNIKHSIGAYTSFKKAIEEGHTSFTFKMTKENIDIFKHQGIKGFRIGLNENGMGYWRMSKICNIKITKYNESYKPIYNTSKSASWININQPTFVGKKDSTEYAAFYFFDNGISSLLNNRQIENISIRFYFEYEYLNDYDDGYDVQYHLCYHNFIELEEALEIDQVQRKNTLCTFKTKKHNPEYIDIILTRKQIEMISEAEGLCVYSKHKNSFTIHKNHISLFINYVVYEQNTYEREFNALRTKTFLLEDKKVYSDQFICGSNNVGHVYRPFAYLGDNFYEFLNKEEVIDIKIVVSLSTHYRYNNRYSYDSLSNVEFYTHNISFNEANYYAYKYNELLFKVDSKDRRYFEIDLTQKQIELLKASFGLGAIIDNNTENNFIVIEDFNIIVTYTRES